MASSVVGPRVVDTLATVSTVTVWVAVVPILNVVVPFALVGWFVLSTLSFGAPMSAERVAEQVWKLIAARATSTVATVAIAVVAVVLRRMDAQRRNLWVALALSAMLTIFWFSSTCTCRPSGPAPHRRCIGLTVSDSTVPVLGRSTATRTVAATISGVIVYAAS